MKSILPLTLLILSALTVTAQEPAANDEQMPIAEPAETPADSQPITPKPTPKPKVIPQTWGDRTGPVYIGHRTVTERHTEWGWVWPEKDNSRKARWIMIQEIPGQTKIPGRFLDNPKGDDHYEYKLYGEFLPCQGYDPNYDLYVDVFRIKGFEVIGKADPLELRPPTTSSGNKKRPLIAPRHRSIDYDY
ncbi:MAG: hypothetical protein LBD30_03970 [Verrucomicrobiales bacterium]|jgi:hypothetical protein|nr:hypothetical protein [Verrucomicrobiales bacterium]